MWPASVSRPALSFTRAMAGVAFEHVAKDPPDGTRAVDDLTLEIRDDEFVVSAGPSGSGKARSPEGNDARRRRDNGAVRGRRLFGSHGRVRNLETPLQTLLRTETGSAAVLLGGVVAALVWANVDVESYVHVWEKTTLSIHVGDSGLSNDLRYCVNAGLMTLFFFVIGLEARHEFDLGELP